MSDQGHCSLFFEQPIWFSEMASTARILVWSLWYWSTSQGHRLPELSWTHQMVYDRSAFFCMCCWYGCTYSRWIVDEVLIQILKWCPFWKNSADVFMCYFTGTFLIRSRRITIEYMYSIFFNFCWIRKLGAVVRQPYRWKDLVEHLKAKCFVQLIHDQSDRGRVVMVPQEACLEWPLNPCQSQNAIFAFDGIAFKYCLIWVRCHVCKVVIIGSSFAAVTIYFLLCCFVFPGLHSDSTRHIDRSCLGQSVVNQTICLALLRAWRQQAQKPGCDAETVLSEFLGSVTHSAHWVPQQWG